LSELPKGLLPTTWDIDSYWMTKDFSFAEAFEVTSDAEFAPFILTEASVSFVLCLLFNDSPTYFGGVPNLGTVMFRLRSTGWFSSDFHDERSWNEYSDEEVKNDYDGEFTQMVFWNTKPHTDRLAEHGRVILVNTRALPELIDGFISEKTWSYPEDSEIGEIYVHQMCR